MILQDVCSDTTIYEQGLWGRSSWAAGLFIINHDIIIHDNIKLIVVRLLAIQACIIISEKTTFYFLVHVQLYCSSNTGQLYEINVELESFMGLFWWIIFCSLLNLIKFQILLINEIFFFLFFTSTQIVTLIVLFIYLRYTWFHPHGYCWQNVNNSLTRPLTSLY